MGVLMPEIFAQLVSRNLQSSKCSCQAGLSESSARAGTAEEPYRCIRHHHKTQTLTLRDALYTCRVAVCLLTALHISRDNVCTSRNLQSSDCSCQACVSEPGSDAAEASAAHVSQIQVSMHGFSQVPQPSSPATNCKVMQPCFQVHLTMQMCLQIPGG